MGDKKKLAHWCDKLARWFDLIFACGFAGLSVWAIIGGSDAIDIDSLARWVLIGYYIFFGLFMLLAWTENKTLHKYCGFLKGPITKSMLYLFCATLAFASVKSVPCIIVGSMFGSMAIFNLMRLCCKDEGDHAKNALT